MELERCIGAQNAPYRARSSYGENGSDVSNDIRCWEFRNDGMTTPVSGPTARQSDIFSEPLLVLRRVEERVRGSVR